VTRVTWAEFHREPARGLDAGVRHEADEDDLLDAVLLELLIEVRVGEAALRPVLLDDDVAWLRDEVRVPFAAPGAFGEGLAGSGWGWRASSARSPRAPSGGGARRTPGCPSPGELRSWLPIVPRPSARRSCVLPT
jgi:hypothetical protein